MKQLVVIGLCVAFVGSFALVEAGGRPDKDKDWFGHVAAGYSVAHGDFSDLVDNGWTLDGGATFWPQDWPVGINLDLGYSQYDISNKALSFLNEQIDMDPSSTGNLTGGDADIWNVSADVMWGPDTGNVGFYLIGGLGVDYVYANVTSTGTVYYPPICGWWWCIPGGVGQGDIVRGSQSETDWSWNAGVGLTIAASSWGSQLYIEARYRSVQTDHSTVEYVPIVIGYRW
jgi:hypothetical protein